MRIRELQLIKYGKFTDRHVALPQRERDIHLIVGPNEAGKSTLRAAISDWLFGIPVRSKMAFLHAMPELRLGGVLEHARIKTLPPMAFMRSKGSKNTLRDVDDQPLPDDALRPWLGSLDGAAFNRMYALDHTALVEGSAGILSEANDVGRLLFQSAAGLVHLGQAFSRLNQEANGLWAPRRAAKRQFYQDDDAYKAASEQLQQASLSANAWQEAKDALSATESCLQQARARAAGLQQTIVQMERLQRIRPMLQTWALAQAEHQQALSAGASLVLPADVAQRVQTASRALDLARAEQQRLVALQRELSEALQTGQWSPELLDGAVEITELDALRQLVATRERDLPLREVEAQTAWQQAQTQVDALGWSHGSAAELSARLPTLAQREHIRQLLTARAALVSQVQLAQAQWQSSEQALAQVRQDLTRLDAVAMDGDVPLEAPLEVALEEALAQALQLGPHEARLRQAQHRESEAAQAVAHAWQAIGVWQQSPEILQSMAVPSWTQVQAMWDQRRDDEREWQRLTGEFARQQAQEQDLAQVARQWRQPPALTDESLQPAREARDAFWHALRQGQHELPSAGLAFEHLQRQADQLADARATDAPHEAERHRQAQALEQLRVGLRQVEQGLMQHCAAMAQGQQAWLQLLREHGMPDLPLEDALPWLQQREQVLLAMQEQARAQDSVARLVQAGQVAQGRLWRALTARGTAVGAMPELAACIRQAQAELRRMGQDQGRREVLAQRVAELSREAHTQHTAHQAAQAAWAQWQSRWQVALADAAYAPETGAAQLEREVVHLEPLDRALERLHRLQHEHIEPMRADVERLASQADALAAQFAPELRGAHPAEISQTLMQRLTQAKAQAQRHAETERQLQRCSADLAQQQHAEQTVQATVQPWLSAAGVADVAALQPCIARADLQRVLAQRVREAEQAVLQAADGGSLAQWQMDSEAVDADALPVQLAQAKAQWQAAMSDIDALIEDRGVNAHALAMFTGAERAAQAEGQRQEAMASMVDTVERYLKRRTETMVLQWALDRFRETQQGPLLNKASALFRTLSGGSFERLAVDASSGAHRLLGLRAADPLGVGVEGMSDGTRDQLYLALRLASLSLQAEQGATMPLIADDLFINFDDERTLAGFQVLGELSRHMQVVVLTHHEHVVPLARQALGKGLNVVRL